jgi:hypothetical protein
VLGDLTGIQPHFLETDQTIAGVPADTTKLTALVGSPPQVDLKDGLRRMVAARRPDLTA